MQLQPKITVLSDSATPAIADIMARTEPARMARVMRQPLETFTRQHLARNGLNKKGWPSTGFWEDASRATVATAESAGVQITVNKLGVRQRYYGGPIAPVSAKALAIPISPISYGKLPREFQNLFLITTKKGAYLCSYLNAVGDAEKFHYVDSRATAADVKKGLAGKAGESIRRKKKGKIANPFSRRELGLGFTFLFKLSSGLVQKPDPTVIPSDDEFTEVAFAALERSLK